MSYTSKIYRKPGGDELVVASGGVITVESGGEIEIQTGGILQVNASNLDVAELAYLDGITAGAALASKALVLGASKEIATITTLTATNINVGAAASAGTLNIYPTTTGQGYFSIGCADQGGARIGSLRLDARTQTQTIHIPDAGAVAEAYLVMTSAVLSLAEADVLQDVTAGTAAASKAVVLDSSKGVISLGRLTQGAFHSTTQGSGLAINPTYTAALRVYADDAGAALTPSGAVPDLRVILGRYLITANQSAVHARVWGAMGQVKIYDALFSEEQCGGVNGRLEIVQAAGTTTLAGYGVSSGVCGILATAGATLVNTNHVAAAVSAIADIKGTLTQTGVVAGVYVGIYNTSQWSDATARAAFTYGLYIATSSCATGVSIGTCTTGVSLSGTQTTGISIGASVATSIAAVTPATFTGIPAANGIIYANTTAVSTTPGSVRAIVGAVVQAATTTTGTVVGVRGSVTGTTALSNYAYGAQGKIILDSVVVTAGSNHVCGLMAQISGSGMTATSGHIAGLIVSGQTLPASANVNMIYIETGGANINAAIQFNCRSNFLFDINNFESCGIVAAAGTGSGSAGQSGGFAATRVLVVQVDGATAYIPLCSTNA